MHLRKKILTLFLGFCFYTAYGGIMYSQIPDSIVSIEGEDISQRPFSPQLMTVPVSENTSEGRLFPTTSESEIRLCGIIPIKTVPVRTIPSITVVPGGNIVGIKLYTKGVVVVSTDSFFEGAREISPGLRHGIKPGDVILAVDGEEVSAAEELSSKIKTSAVTLTLSRDGEIREVTLTPYVTDGVGKLGLWVRDSCAGIGTLTFYRPDTGTYGALGHGLTDSESGIVLPTSGGELTAASVISVVKGKSGVPGELCGIFSASSIPLGTLETNTGHGISGTLTTTDFLSAEPCRLCPRDEIKCGKAYILSCVSGTDVEKYEIEIQRVYSGEKGASKDMLIRITDESLLEKTGGIVQGMSGSPIVQNGKLVGAVTHVLVNDPTRGYGIFIENMLADAEKFN